MGFLGVCFQDVYVYNGYFCVNNIVYCYFGECLIYDQ